MGTVSRPDAVRDWIKGARKLDKVPKGIAVAVFMDDWRGWYRGLMPDWRLINIHPKKNWPLRRDVHSDEEWVNVRKGERNGLFLLLLSLSWWKQITEPGSEERDQYESALEDFAWLLPQLSRNLTPNQLRTSSGTENDTGLVVDGSRKRKTTQDDPSPLTQPTDKRRKKVGAELGGTDSNSRSLRSSARDVGAGVSKARAARKARC